MYRRRGASLKQCAAIKRCRILRTLSRTALVVSMRPVNSATPSGVRPSSSPCCSSHRRHSPLAGVSNSIGYLRMTHWCETISVL